MNPADPLADLRDIHLPAAVSAWPPGPLWWLLLLMLVAALVLSLRWWVRHRRRNAYRRQALAQVQAIYTQWQSDANDQRYLEELNSLLKRVALHAYPGADSAPLSGAAWVEFLDLHWRLAPAETFKDCLPVDAHYQAITAPTDIDRLQITALKWLQQHRGPAC